MRRAREPRRDGRGMASSRLAPDCGWRAGRDSYGGPGGCQASRMTPRGRVNARARDSPNAFTQDRQVTVSSGHCGGTSFALPERVQWLLAFAATWIAMPAPGPVTALAERGETLLAGT